MNCIVKFLCTRKGQLIFSLAGGLAYFLIILQFIRQYSRNGSMLLGFFFCPAIICGMALVLIKLLRSWQEQELYSRMAVLFFTHVLLFLISIVFLAGLLFS